MTCAKTQGFLAQHEVTSKSQADAGKNRLGADDALKLAREADQVIAMKGKKVVTIDMKSRPADEELLAVMLGPTGNLRAPTIRRGRTLLVGFDEETYRRILG